jgi:hypothetical protein
VHHISNRWTPGLEIPTINAAFWYLGERLPEREICNANDDTNGNALVTYGTEQWLVTATDHSLSSFRVVSRGTGRKHLAASLAPAVLPLTLRAAISFTTISSCSAVVRPLGAGEARIGRFRHDSPRIHLYSGERRAHSQLEGSHMAIERFVSHVAVQPGWSARSVCMLRDGRT